MYNFIKVCESRRTERRQHCLLTLFI